MIKVGPANVRKDDKPMVRELDSEGSLGIMNTSDVNECVADNSESMPKIIGPEIMLPSQLPADIHAIVEKIGQTRRDTKFVCVLNNGDKVIITLGHLKSLVGEVEYTRLFNNFVRSQML